MTEGSAETRRPVGNKGAPPSLLTLYGSQIGIIGVGFAMWLAFVIAAPRVFTDVDIYLAFARDDAAVRHHCAVADLRRHHRRDRPFVSFGHGARHGGVLSRHRLCRRAVVDRARLPRLRPAPLCGFLNGLLVASLNIPSLVITIGTSFLYPRPRTRPDERHRRAADWPTNIPQMHALLREPLFGVPVQTLWMSPS